MCQKRKPKTIPKKEKGLTIIGLLIAIAIISLSLTTGLGLITRNLRLASITAHEITAAALAQEGIELVRNIRDTGDNYCLNPSHPISPLNGFDRIDNPQSYAIDNDIDTYTNGQGGNKILTGNSHFKQNNAGLCPNGDGNYATCAIDDANRQFIRKIQILEVAYNDGAGGTIPYDCETVNGEGGVLAVVTVYWSEFWENNWPNNANTTEDSLWKENNKTLHRVRVSKCFYDWRPE